MHPEEAPQAYRERAAQCERSPANMVDGSVPGTDFRTLNSNIGRFRDNDRIVWVTVSGPVRADSAAIEGPGVVQPEAPPHIIVP
jgi:hypothetical protein